LLEVVSGHWKAIVDDTLYQILIDRVAGAVHAKASKPGGKATERTLRNLDIPTLRESARGRGEIPGVDTTGWAKNSTRLTREERPGLKHKVKHDAELRAALKSSARKRLERRTGGTPSGLEKAWQALISFFNDLCIALGLSAGVLARILGTIDRVLERFRLGSDHGLHATVVEEVLRDFYLTDVGAAVWQQMKTDIGDAFAGDPETCFGSALVQELGRLDPKGKRVLVVGHSAGAIYACALLQAVHAAGVQVPIDTVLLAAAARDELLASTLTLGAVGDFRSFALNDTLERADVLLNGVLDNALDWFYPMSLLYLISGVLEPDVDAPLVGMQRFTDPEWWGAGQPAVTQVAEFLKGSTGRAIWSVANSDDLRFAANAEDHGDFGHPTLTFEKTNGQPNRSIQGVVAMASRGFGSSN